MLGITPSIYVRPPQAGVCPALFGFNLRKNPAQSCVPLVFRGALLLISITVTVKIFAQNNDLITELKALDTFQGHIVGEEHSNSPNWIILNNLLKTTNKEELFRLLNDLNGVTRCYAAIGLVLKYKDEIDLYEIAKKSLSDFEVISTLYYDIMGREYVGDIIIDYIISEISYYEVELLYITGVSQKSNLQIIQNSLRTRKFPKTMYEGIKEWALSGNKNAIVALSAYQKQQDFELLLPYYKVNNKKGNTRDNYIDSVIFFLGIANYASEATKKYYIESFSTILLKGFTYYPTIRAYYEGLLKFNDKFAAGILENISNTVPNKKEAYLYYVNLEIAKEIFRDTKFSDFSKIFEEKYNQYYKK
ncbi:MAG: hypothetical protein Ta2G_08450 [Termitinemataceae bacterium]|nr:MAG: hypothetical protein Ta2G_08450 [Termitinemataceae bacterium]